MLRLRYLTTVMALWFVGLPLQGRAAQKPTGETQEKKLDYGGAMRSYRIRVPASYDGKTPTALVFVLHGNGGTSQTAEQRLGFNPLSDQHGFIVIYPQGLGKHWNDGRVAPRFVNAVKIDDVGFFRALLENLQKSYTIDPDRIFVAGASNGGFMAHRLGWELSDKLAGIASVAGTMGKDVAAQFAPKHPINVLHMHGTKDPTVPYDGGQVAKEGGIAVSAPALVRMWAKVDGCHELPVVDNLPKADEKDTIAIRRETFTKGDKGAEVVLYTIENLGHTWLRTPSLVDAPAPQAKPLNAAEVIWHFFAAHPKAKP